MAENQTLGPRGWVSGWMVSLRAGLAISTFWGVSLGVITAAFTRNSIDTILLGGWIWIASGLGVFAFGAVWGSLFVTIGYVFLRLLARRFQPTLTTRVVTGLCLATAMVVGLHSRTVAPSNNLYSLTSHTYETYLDDIIVAIPIGLSALTLAIVARPRWFGVP